MTGQAPRLSLVLPCLNGSAYIADSMSKLFRWLDAHATLVGRSEVILVDDGSRDHTAAVATATGFPIRIVRHPETGGKSAAVRSGMHEAAGQCLVFIDADMPFDLDAIERVLHYLDAKEFDLCIGTRAARGEAYSVGGSRLRRFSSRLFTEFVGRLVVTGVRDTQCGLKGFRAPVAEYLFSQSRVDSFAFDVELLYLAFKNGFDVKSVPVTLGEQASSTVSVFGHGIPMLLDVLKLPLRFHRGEYELFGSVSPPS